MGSSQASSSGAIIKIGSKKKIAFVCSGGAAKAGAFHLGVALALQEQGFKFYSGLNGQSSDSPKPMEVSTYVGSSAGAVISTLLATGYSLDSIFNSFLEPRVRSTEIFSQKKLAKLTYQKMLSFRPSLDLNPFSYLSKMKELYHQISHRDWDALMSLKWLNFTGFFSTEGVEKYLREEVLPSNDFKDYRSDLFIVATQLDHSRKVVFGKHHFDPPPYALSCQYDSEVSISDACAASLALPGIYAPHPIKKPNQKEIFYIDGEIRDTLSTHVATDNGSDLVFASHTHQPLHVNENEASIATHGLPAILVQSIYLLVEQKINSHIYNRKCQNEAIDAVSDYCKNNNLSESHRKAICTLLEKKLHYKKGVDIIYIHPSPEDQRLFLSEHFSLSVPKLREMVKSGFRAAIHVLKQYEFKDRAESHAFRTVE